LWVYLGVWPKRLDGIFSWVTIYFQLVKNPDANLFFDSGSSKIKSFTFIAFVAEQQEVEWKITEDGCTRRISYLTQNLHFSLTYSIVFLTDQVAEKICDTLLTGKDLKIPISTDVTFCINFYRTSYQDPVTGATLTTADGSSITTFYPTDPESPKGHDSHVKVEGVFMFKQPEETDALAVVGYVEQIRSELESRTPEDGQGLEPKLLYVKFELPPSHDDWLTVSVTPNPTGLDMQTICNAIAELQTPDIEGQTVIQVAFGLWGAEAPEYDLS